MRTVDVLVIGAGAAGMMCAIEAGRRGRSVLVLDHARAPGEKIRISGGGRCNFTNLATPPEAFLSDNPRFCRSALSRFGPERFLAMVEARGIAWREKAKGQLFCDGPATQIVSMLTDAMAEAGVALRLGAPLRDLRRHQTGFSVRTDEEEIGCDRLVVATGGKSIPKMGATGLAYEIAERFGLRIVPTRPGLAPLTFEAGLLERLRPLAGVSVPAAVSHGRTRFEDAMLFTHRGLSGPAILQISSYWRPGEAIEIAMAPGVDLFATLKSAKVQAGRQALQTVLAQTLPARLAAVAAQAAEAGAPLGQSSPGPAARTRANLADLPDAVLRAAAEAVNAWRVKPVGSEGYRTAEVTVGGVDTRDLDPRSFEALQVRGLHFIGEALDVTGWLGGYNFQWAWASGWCAGQAV